jgi:hypothetical protein
MNCLTDINLAILLKIVQSSVRALKTRQFNSNVGMTDWATHSSLTEIDLAILLEIVQDDIRLLDKIYGDRCYKSELVGREQFLCKVVPRIERLEHLSLSRCRVGPTALAAIVQIHGRSLYGLFLQECIHIHDGAIGQVAKHCPNLCWLDLSGCELLTDAAINSISQGCSLLTSLRLNSCKRLKSVSLEHLNKGCTALTRLKVARCVNLSQRALIEFVHAHKEVLECIDVSFIPLIGNCLVKALSKCPKLRKLSLSYNPEEGLITNKSFFWFNQKVRKGSYRWDEHHDHYK